MAFSNIIKETLNYEGGYAKVKGDNGGETYRGITRRNFPNWPGWVMVDAEKFKNGGSLAWNTIIKSQALEQLVKDFYEENFYEKYKLNYLIDESVEGILFDSIVNSGSTAMKQAQTVANTFGKNIAVDGYLGLQSVAAINACPQESFFNKYKAIREQFYVSISKNTGQSKFLKGWLSRIGKHTYRPILGVLSIGFFIGSFFLRGI